MANIPINFALASFTWTLAGDAEPMSISMGFDVPVGIINPDVIASDLSALFTDATDGFWTPSIAANSYTYKGVRVYYNSAGIIEVGEYVTTSAGSRGTSCPPNNCSVITKKETGRLGRKYRGRFYCPPFYVIAANLAPTGVIDSSDVAAIQLRAERWRINCAGDDYVMNLFHTDPAIPPTIITRMETESQLGTQRRRMRG